MLTIKNLSKSYGETPVLRDVSLSVGAGKIQGLIGENGAGKSTLVKCLLELTPYQGEILAPRGQIAAIHQEFNLANDLTVTENIFLGRERRGKFFLDRPAMRRITREKLALLRRVDIDPDTRVGDLTIFAKQAVEIAKALTGDCRLLIMDEPSTLLNREETALLFALMRNFVGAGKTIIYISHKLAEVREICDDIAVLRDGVLVSNAPAATADVFALARKMVGRELTQMFPPKLSLADTASTSAPAPTPALEISALRSGDQVRGATLTLHGGEILGLAGLAGAGRTELAETVCGLRRRDGGALKLFGREVNFKHPAQAFAAGISYLAEDRKESGVLLDFSVTENITLANLRHYCRAGFLRPAARRGAAQKYVERFKINTPSLDAPLARLSGGNQQKVAIAKGLDGAPRVFIFDEPTRGVDVAARRDIYDSIHELAAQGVACLMIGSDLEELLGMCSRILVMRQGTIIGELRGDNLTEEQVMYLATGVAENL